MDASTDSLRLIVVSPDGEVQVNIPRSNTGKQLKDHIERLTGIPADKQKALVGGKFLKDNETLQQQNIREGAKVLLMLRKDAETTEAQNKKEDIDEHVSRLLKVAEQMASREEGSSKYHFEITDQDGRVIDIPAADKKALKIGLSLHDIGKKHLAKGETEVALQYLLAADKSFSACSPKYLQLVDNYGFLSLDIVWAYYLTQNLDFLQEASSRLSRAEETFKHCYGPNQERLLRLKGGCCPEMVVYVRLYAMYAVVYYHQGNWERAKSYLETARHYLRDMTITESELLPLVEMGYDIKEARIALRATNKSVERAVQYIDEQRKRKAQIKAEERARRKREKEKRKLGKCADGKSWVDLDILKELMDMGFEKALIVEGLKQSNNDKDATITMLTTNVEVLEAAATANFRPTPSMIKQVMEVGFSKSQAIAALKRSRGNVEMAVNILLAEPELEKPTDDDSSDDEEEEEDKKNEEEEEEEEDVSARDELIQGLSDENDYLDINLDAEAAVISKYKSLLEEKGFRFMEIK